MGLILCKSKKAEHPYFIDTLGIHIYSLEELCYVIYEYPILAMDNFVNNRLSNFIAEDLGDGEFIMNCQKSGILDDTPAFLIALLDYSGYYSPSELIKFKTHLVQIEHLNKLDYNKVKADQIFALNKFGKSIRYYKSAIKLSESYKADVKVQCALYNNLGSAYANQFFYDEAYEAYDKAYELIKDPGILKKIYFLTLLDPSLNIRERYSEIITESKMNAWNKEYNEKIADAMNSERINEIDQIFENDSVKKRKGISAILNNWKIDYRNMI